MGIRPIHVLVLVILAALGYGAYWVYETQVVAPYKRLVEYNRRERVYDPLDDVFGAPVKKDEGFVCPGTTLRGAGSVADAHYRRVMKVKVIEEFGSGVVGVKVLDGQSEINNPYLPEYRMYARELRKSPECSPPEKGQDR